MFSTQSKITPQHPQHRITACKPHIREMGGQAGRDGLTAALKRLAFALIQTATRIFQ